MIGAFRRGGGDTRRNKCCRHRGDATFSFLHELPLVDRTASHRFLGRASFARRFAAAYYRWKRPCEYRHPCADARQSRSTLLGGFAPSVDGRAVPDSAWRLKKARELVKLLALAPRSPAAPRAGDGRALARPRARRPPRTTSIRPCTSRGARSDADAIELRDGAARRSRPSRVDVDEFEHAAADARRAGTAGAYRAALALYGGELLPENRYDDWADGPARRARRAGRRARRTSSAPSARRTATACRGCPPRRARSSAATASSTSSRRCSRGTRLLTLAGTGGAGKTRLALELARGAEPSYADGAALVELAPVAEPALVAGRGRGRARRAGAARRRTLGDAVADFLAPRVAAARAGQLRAPAGGDRRARRRAAARRRPAAHDPRHQPRAAARAGRGRLPGAVARDPRSRAGARARASSLALRGGARCSSSGRARRRPASRSTSDNAADVARICFRLDGLPLALELAAGRLGALGPAAIAERLDDRFRLLRAGSRAAPTRQQTLTATLEWSHDLLEPRRARCCSAAWPSSPGGFDLEAAEAVCAGDGLERRDGRRRARAAGGEVARRGRRGASRERRYRLLETVRLYARERLDEAGERRGARRAPRRAGRSRWPSAERGSPRLDREAREPARGARHAARRAGPQEALRLCVALCPFWLRRIDLDEAQRRYAEALAAAPERTALRAEALLAAAAIDFRSGTLAHAGPRSPRRAGASRSSSATRAREWRALQFLGEFGVASDAVDVAMPLASSRRSSSRAARASPPRRRSASTRSASPAGSSATSPRAEELAGRERRALPRARRLAGARSRRR